MIDLKPFYDSSDRRHWLSQPWSRDGFTWATNGKILIRVPQRDDAPEATDKLDDRDRVRQVVQRADTAAFYPFDWHTGALDIRDPCTKCHGRGEGHKCGTCGGSGKHDCDCEHCEAACDDCDGDGFRPVKDAEIDMEKRMTCPTCQGTKLDPTTKRIYFDEVKLCLAADLLSRILALPGPIEMAEYVDRHSAQLFRGPDWLAALMPMIWREPKKDGDIIVTESVIK